MIKNILFDLGGVLLNIDFERTFAEFDRLRSVTDADWSDIPTTKQLFDLPDVRKILQNFETGHSTPEQFRAQLMERVGINIPYQDFDRAWNALLLDYPADRTEVVPGLSQKYRTFLLSNTNKIHCDYYNELLNREFGIPSLGHLMEKAFYAFEMQLRKPDPLIYYKALKDAQLEPEETLFIDDCEENLESAKRLGIQTVLVSGNYSIVDVFSGANL